jgi:1-phosphatidylinositol-4-phosphate 5-kinase
MRRIMHASDPHHLGTTLDLPASPSIPTHIALPSTPTSHHAVRTYSGARPRSSSKATANTLQTHLTQDRERVLFYQDEGGLQATDEGNEEIDVIYYLGIIDILTPYGGLKKAEHFWKGMKADRVSVNFWALISVAVAFLCFESLSRR